MQQASMFTQPVMVAPSVAKKGLDARLAQLREKIETQQMPVLATASRKVTFEELPTFFAQEGITTVQVDFPETGPFAGQMVVRRIA